MTRVTPTPAHVRLRGCYDWRHLSHAWLLFGMAGTPLVLGVVFALLQR